MNILITGAAVGIGAQIALDLAANNNLILHYCHSSLEAEQVKNAVLAKGASSVKLFQCDLTNEAGCESLADFCSSEFDCLDVLVNNAGGMVCRESIGEMKWETLSKSFALNVFSTMYLTSLVRRQLDKAETPSVINITSIAMRHGSPTATAYGAAKSAIDSFTRGAARELGPHIRVNAIAPGIIDTRFHEKVSSTEKMETWREASLLKKHGRVEDISSTVRFVIDNHFLTGETIDVNGGLFTR